MALQDNRDQNQTPSLGDLNPADLDKEIEQALGGASIEDLMAQAVSKGTPTGPTMDPSRPVRGGRPSARDRGERTAPDNIKRGKVVSIREGNVFVDLGGKSQGMCPLEQFDEVPPEAAGEAPKGVEIGVEYEFIFKGYDSREGLVMLARRGATVHGPWETLQPGDIVEATVTGVNKGGLELKVNNARAFMPAGQVDIKFNPDLSVFLNQRFTCEVTKVDRADQNIILSRRGILEAEQAKAGEKTWEELAVGQIREGTVRSVQQYGAFVDLGGVDGLLHVSAMSHTRVSDPKKIVSEGAKIQVMILGVDREKKRVSLGLKQLGKDPWDNVPTDFPVGTTITGTVKRIVDFGAFVELAPGVEGLVHISQVTTKRINKVSEILKEGQSVQAKVMQIDMEKKRVSLSIADVERDTRASAAPAMAETASTGTATSSAPGSTGGVAIPAAAKKPTKPERKTPLKGGLS